MSAERPITPETMLLGRYRHLFVADPTQFALGRDDGSYIRVRKPVTDQILGELLRGRLTVGLYMLTPEGQAIQGVVDSDRTDGLKDLQQIAFKLQELGLRPLLEGSARGGHLRFVMEPTDPDVPVRLLQQVLSVMDVTAEVFPRGRGLSNVRAPLSRHPVAKRSYPFLDVETLRPVAADIRGNLAYLADITRANHREIAEALAKAFSTPWTQRRPPEGHMPQRTIGKPDILEVVGADRVIEKAGKHFRTLCPFHADSKPSLVIYQETNSWFCFSCRKGGDSVHYMALRQGVRDGEVLRRLRG